MPQVKINQIPVFDAIISDEETGMMKISLVDDPAVMSNFLAFGNQRKVQLYSIQDEEKRLVRGVVMRCNFPIYRFDNNLGEYYIIYKADQIRKMAEKYLFENRQNNINIMHQENTDVTGVQMVQYFIKDTEHGVNPAGFEDIADGSLFAEFHVINDSVWDEIKKGTFKGFSLEGIFDLVPEENLEQVQDIVSSLRGAFKRILKHSNTIKMSKTTRFFSALAKLLEQFGNVTTDEGVLGWDGEEDLQAGDAVFMEDEEGNRTPAEDGEYKTEDAKTIIVADGKVAEIKDPEAEVEPAEADPEETPVEMGKVATDKGDLIFDGEEDLKAGDAVFVAGEEGDNVPAPDGEYLTEDGKVIKVADGVVTEIADKEAETDPEVEELKKANATLKEENAKLKAQIATLKKMSAGKPAHAEVEQRGQLPKTGNKGLDNLARILNAK